VLDMVDRKLEGALLLRPSNNGSFTASFAPNFGGGALEVKTFPDREALPSFLKEIGVSDEAKRQAFLQLDQEQLASIAQVQLSADQLEHYWPTQFGREKSAKTFK
jgi:hypothetical protein